MLYLHNYANWYNGKEIKQINVESRQLNNTKKLIIQKIDAIVSVVKLLHSILVKRINEKLKNDYEVTKIKKKW